MNSVPDDHQPYLDPGRRPRNNTPADEPGPNYLDYQQSAPEPQPQQAPPYGPYEPVPLPEPPQRNSVAMVLALFAVAILVFAALTLVSVDEGMDPDGDEDNDGVINRLDPFPTNPAEWSDLDGDGLGDNTDLDDDGDAVNDTEDLDPVRDLAINFQINWVNLTTKVGSRSQGDLYMELWSNRSGELEQIALLNDNGNPIKVPWQTRTKMDWEAIINVPDDMPEHHLNLRVYEVDRWTPRLVDVDGTDDTYGLTIYYDLVSQTWQGDDNIGQLDGALDNRSDETDGRLGYQVTTVDFGFAITFDWFYDSKAYTLVYRFDPSNYNGYVAADHRITEYDDFVEYATPDDPEVQAIAAKLNGTAQLQGLDIQETANFVLAFVQGLTYTQDNATSGIGEYPRFPVETLVDQRGDCEDTALLYMSLLENMGLETALLILPDATTEAGHAAAGVVIDDYSGDGAYYTDKGDRFYYSETTAVGWVVGQMPSLHDTKAYVYQI